MGIQKFLIPIALLKAASLAISRDDFLRPNLEVLAIEKGHIIATNSHVLFCSKLDIDPEFKVHIPLPHVESFLKKVENFDSYYCELSFDANEKKGLLEIKHCYGAYEAFIQHWDSFIDWQKVIIAKPEKVELSSYPYFDTKYLNTVNEMAQILGVLRGSIYPTGTETVAFVDFKYSEYSDAFVLLMPLCNQPEKIKWAVQCSYDDEIDLRPAESEEIAYKAVRRMKNDLNFSFYRPSEPRCKSRHDNIVVVSWAGSDEEHKKEMFYNQAWFDQPLCQFNNCAQAIRYITELDEVVHCYIPNTDREVITRSVDEVKAFFKRHSMEVLPS